MHHYFVRWQFGAAWNENVNTLEIYVIIIIFI